MLRLRPIALAGTCGLFALVASQRNALSADLLGGAGEGPSIEVHGFVSQGAIKTTENNYLTKSERGSVDFNEVGVNFTSQLTERLRVGFQLFSRHLGAAGNYNVKADWFYLDYRWRDWFGIRAGRVKLPFGLYNDVNDIDAARVPVLLPQSVYPISSRDFLLAQTGFELYGYVTFGRGGGLDYRLYGGTIFIDMAAATPGPIQLVSLDTPYVVGGRLMYDTPVDGMRAGTTLQVLRLDANLIAMAGMPGMVMTLPVTLKLPAVLWVNSFEYVGEKLLVAAEYGLWFVDTESDNPMIYPSSSAVSERLYALAAYRLRNWFQPGAYYSLLTPHIDVRSGPAATQHDGALTLRFDVNAHWLIKLEGHLMYGTAGLNRGLNNNVPLEMLPRTWGVFLLKTTAYF